MQQPTRTWIAGHTLFSNVFFLLILLCLMGRLPCLYPVISTLVQNDHPAAHQDHCRTQDFCSCMGALYHYQQASAHLLSYNLTLLIERAPNQTFFWASSVFTIPANSRVGIIFIYMQYMYCNWQLSFAHFQNEYRLSKLTAKTHDLIFKCWLYTWYLFGFV